MDKVKLLVICAITATAPFAPTAAAPSTIDTAMPRLVQWQSIVTEAAQQFGIPGAWIRGVMRAESGGRTRLNGKPITSPKGAMGLMQVMPSTYRALRFQYGFPLRTHAEHPHVLRTILRRLSKQPDLVAALPADHFEHEFVCRIVWPVTLQRRRHVRLAHVGKIAAMAGPTDGPIQPHEFSKCLRVPIGPAIAGIGHGERLRCGRSPLAW
ncbi:MAG TPA: transglycosylase SLT domain-containing protein [Rhizomicrobium sp.]